MPSDAGRLPALTPNGHPDAPRDAAARSGQALVAPVERLLWDAKELAAALSVSERSLARLDSAGAIPRAIRLGGPRGAKRWRIREIEHWLNEGMPRPELFVWPPARNGRL